MRVLSSSVRPGRSLGSPIHDETVTAVGASLLTCTATTRSGSTALIEAATPAPMSPPWTAYRSYPSRYISSANARPIRPVDQPGSVTGVE